MHLPFAVAADAPAFADDYWVFVHCARRRRRADVDRRPRAADADAAVEAGHDGRVHAHDVRAASFRTSGRSRIEVGPVLAGRRRARCRWRGRTAGTRSYDVATFEMRPRPPTSFVVFSDGWHDPRSRRGAGTRVAVVARRAAASSFRNPKRAVDLYLAARPAGRRPSRRLSRWRSRSAARSSTRFTLAGRHAASSGGSPLTAEQLGDGGHGRADDRPSIRPSCRPTSRR